jgi:uncharacterized protein
MQSKKPFQRLYEIPKSSILLLGPRGTGKSTFVKTRAKPDLVIDLLSQVMFRKLSLNPGDIEDMTNHLKPGQTVLVDEIQKVPELLDEVHRLIEDKQLIFFLTGSSARKLKKTGANLLAGRALSKKFFPLTLKELDQTFNLSQILFSGTLPKAVNAESKDAVNDFLFSYVETYLKEEIFQEAVTRNLNEFSKFIELAGQYNGQIINFENLSREIGKSGDTVKSWFQILQDTLVGQMIESYQFGIAQKETKHPKFYYFDCGVARAAQGVESIEDIPEQRGFYFENLILNELRAYFEVHRKKYKIFYYSISSYGDLDFLIEVKKKTISAPAQFIGLEVKFSKTWKADYEKVILKIKQERPDRLLKAVAIYLGEQRLSRNGIDIFPLDQFIDQLWKHKIF